MTTETASKLERAVGIAAVAIVLGGILFAWTDSISSHLLQAAALLLGVVCAVLAFAGAPFLRSHYLILLPLGCALWGGIQTLCGWTVYQYETFNSVSAWLARAGLFAAAYIGFRNRNRREALITSAIWFGGVFSLLTVVQWYGGKVELSGTFLNRDQFAALIGLLLPFALARTLGNRENSGVLPYAACAGMMFASVIASASRAGTIIVSCEVLFFLGMMFRSKRRDYRTGALVAMALLACTVIGGYSTILERFTAADPFASRREMLTSSIEMIHSRPLTGYGLGTWPSVYPAFAVFDPPDVYMNHAHNDWAEWTAEGGVPFAAMIAILVATAAWLVRKNTWALGIPAVFAHSLVDFPLQKAAIACAVFFFLGVLATAASTQQAPEIRH